MKAIRCCFVLFFAGLFITQTVSGATTYYFTEDTVVQSTNDLYEEGIVVVSNCTLTVDGAHAFEALYVMGTGKITHSACTPGKIYSLELVVAGEVVIGSNATIDVSHCGYGTYYTYGNTTNGGATQTSGGSYGGLGYPFETGHPNWVYGDFRNPNEHGSGGAGDRSQGGPGGGLVRIVSASLRVDGTIHADGHDGMDGAYRWGGGGSGGGIFIDTGLLSGTGCMSANGGDRYPGTAAGGGGRVAVYYSSMEGFSISNITAFGGDDSVGDRYGSPGTVYFESDAGSQVLWVRSEAGRVAGCYAPLGLTNEAIMTVDRLVVSGSNVVAVPNAPACLICADEVEVIEGGMLSHRKTDPVQEYSLNIEVAGTLFVDSISSIDVSTRGYADFYTVGNTTYGGATSESGGSYGGLGFSVFHPGWDIPVTTGKANAVYGMASNPVNLGSGGAGERGSAGSGGGLLRITAGCLTNEGIISADGEDGFSNYAYRSGGGGSGGGLLLNAGVLAGRGVYSANGGHGAPGCDLSYPSGSGGGGRLAVYVWQTNTVSSINIQALGGVDGGGNGGSGSVYYASAPAMYWDETPATFSFGECKLDWSVLGLNPSGYVVNAYAERGGVSIVLGSNQRLLGSLTWDASGLESGIYTLRLICSDHLGMTNLLDITAQTAINNDGLTWHTGVITNSEIWSNDSLHAVYGLLTVATGATVTVQPGTLIKVSDGGGVLAQGEFDARGTEDNPIIMTSLSDDSDGGDSNLDGGASVPMVGDWLGLVSEGGVLRISDYTDIRYTRTTHGGTISSDEVWLGNMLHVLNSNLTVNSSSTLTINPGAIIKFGHNCGITVEQYSKLVAVGLSGQPIVFTSVKDDTAGGDSNRDGTETSPAAGDWSTIYAHGGTIEMAHAELRYGGGTSDGVYEWGAGALRTSLGAILTMNACRIVDGLFEGIHATDGGTIRVTNSIIMNCERAINGDGATVRLVNCTLYGNTIGIWPHGGVVDLDNTIIANSITTGISPGAGTIKYCNVWSPTGDAGAFTPGVNGNISTNPAFVNTANGNFRLNYLSPCIDAADGSLSPVEDCMGAPRYNDPRTTVKKGVPDGNGKYPDMGAYEFTEGASSDVDMIVVSVVGPAEASAGSTSLVTWVTRNVGSAMVQGAWVDRLTFVPQGITAWDVATVVADVPVSGTIGPGHAVTNTAYVRTPGGTENNWSWQVDVNACGDIYEGANNTNNTCLSEASTWLTVPEVGLGKTISADLTSLGAPLWYKINQPASTDVVAVIHMAEDDSAVCVYGGYGVMPTVSGYDLTSPEWNSSWVTLMSPGKSMADTVYLRIQPERLPEGASAVTVSVRAVTFMIESVGLDSAGNAGPVTIPVYGGNFDSTCRVLLRPVGGGTEIQALTGRVVNAILMNAEFNLTGVPAGVYDVVVKKGVAESVLSNGFTVTAGTGGEFYARIILPAALRYRRPFEGIIEYGNRGDADVAIPLLGLYSPSGNPVWLNDEYYYWPRTHTVNSNRVEWLAVPPSGAFSGTLRPGESARVVFHSIACNADEGVYRVDIKNGDSTDTVDWAALYTNTRPSGADAYWPVAWSSMVAVAGSDYAGFIGMMGDAVLDARMLNMDLITVQDALIYQMKNECLRTISADAVLCGTVMVQQVALALANVQLCDDSGWVVESVRSGYDGSFAMVTTNRGSFNLVVENYLPSPCCEVVLTDSGTNLALDVYAAASVGGLITDAETGAAVTNAGVYLVNAFSNTWSLPFSDPNGYFLQKGLASGEYRMHVRAEGYVHYESGRFQVDSGTVHTVTAALKKGTMVSGQVLNNVGQPVSNAWVTLSDTKGVSVSTFADDQGAFELTGVQGGTYTLKAKADGFAYGCLSNIEVVACTPVTGLSASLKEAGRANGTVRDGITGLPLAGVAVCCESSVDWETVRTDASGNYLSTNLPAGAQRIWYMLEGYVPTIRSEDITAGAQHRFDVDLYPPVSLKVQVTDNGSPASGFFVDVTRDELNLTDVLCTDTNGEVENAGLIYTNYHIGLRSGNSLGAYLRYDAVTFTEGTLCHTVKLDVASAKLSGIVRNADGTPNTNATVTLLFENQFAASSYLDEAGRYTFQLFQAGSAAVYAASAELGYAVHDDLQIILGTDINDADVQAPIGSALRVKVCSSEGVLTNAVVQIDPVWPVDVNNMSLIESVDLNGMAVFPNLPADEYSLQVLACDRVAACSKLMMGAQDVTVTNVLALGRTLYGYVRDQKGNPVGNAHLSAGSTVTNYCNETFSRESGYYELNGMMPSIYAVSVYNGSNRPVSVTNLDMAAVFSMEKDFIIDRSSAGAVLEVVVKDAMGCPVSGAYVSARDENQVLLAVGQTGADGVWTENGFPACSLSVAVQAYSTSGIVERAVSTVYGTTTECAVAVGVSAAAVLTEMPVAEKTGKMVWPETENGETRYPGTINPNSAIGGTDGISPGCYGNPSTGSGSGKRVTWKYIKSIFRSEYQPAERQAKDTADWRMKYAHNDMQSTHNVDCTGWISNMKKCRDIAECVDDSFGIWASAYENGYDAANINGALILMKAGVFACKAFLAISSLGKGGVSADGAISKKLNNKMLRELTKRCANPRQAKAMLGISGDLVIALSDAIGTIRSQTMKNPRDPETWNNVKSIAEGFVQPLLSGERDAIMDAIKSRAKFLGKDKRDALLKRLGKFKKGTKFPMDGLSILGVVTDFMKFYDEQKKGFDDISDAQGWAELSQDTYLEAVSRYDETLHDQERRVKENNNQSENPNISGNADHTVTADSDLNAPDDPNEIVGPTGYGVDRWMAAGEPFLYTIRFENKTNATASAQEIVITNSISSLLDWSTFELVAFCLGTNQWYASAGLQQYSSVIDYQSECGLNLSIAAGLAMDTGVASWHFTGLDPVTGELTTDPFAGILPPNTNAPQGEGFVSYMIRPKTNLTASAIIEAKAGIIFDLNDVIVTDEITNRLDTVAPVSDITRLGIRVPRMFGVPWAGSDVGSGIARYDVYVSVNSNAYSLWVGTEATSGTYTGTVRSTYDFLVRAVDNVGNMESKSVPDASTTVGAPLKNDFDGDGRSDIGCYYDKDGFWYIYKSTAGFWTTRYGYEGTDPVTGDFDGDNICDYGIYYPPSGQWNIMCSTAGPWENNFGYDGTVPVTGDFDGDGLCDFGCYYAPGGNWYIYKSRDGFWQNNFGYEGTVPVTGDFDGDGIADFGCYYAPEGNWYLYKSKDGFWVNQFGYEGTIPVTGDFDGDGLCDFGCYYAPGGNWYIYKSRDGFWENNFGYGGTVPITGDYDGDVIDDFGCYYAPDGNWYIYSSSEGFYINQFGYEGTVPVGQ